MLSFLRLRKQHPRDSTNSSMALSPRPAVTDNYSMTEELSDDEDVQKRVSPVPVTADRVTNFKVRTVWTLVLIFSFFVIIAAGHLYCSLLVLVIMGAVFYEITKLKRNIEKEHRLPFFFGLRWFWFILTYFYLLKVFLPLQLENLGQKSQLVGLMLKYHTLICYSLSIAGLVVFVLSLRRFTLRYQFQQLSWAMITLLVVVMQGAAYMANIYNGLVWFLLPTLLVIANDIFAYIFGFAFGRTPLIKLSPKKTWEGFIGGSISTVLIAVLLCEIFERFPFFMCPVNEFTVIPFDFASVQCPEYVPPSAGVASQLKIHGLILASFASLVAPFGGFFASGFKRAFKIKDFGDSIPGHGGITDRFDCQIIMGMFTYTYFNTFVGRAAVHGISILSVESVISYIQALSPEDRNRILDAILPSHV